MRTPRKVPEMSRLPPNQVKATRWKTYSALGEPTVDLDAWRLRISGEVERPLELKLNELMSMKTRTVVGGFHCVEGWSIPDAVWEGVQIGQLAELSQYRREAEWIIFRGLDGYSAPVPVEYALDEDSIIALKLNGAPLPYEHGFPARPILPRLYAWKSVKWLTEIHFSSRYVDGYWEARGYHPRGDVWLEERKR